jgi:hypothetical protein
MKQLGKGKEREQAERTALREAERDEHAIPRDLHGQRQKQRTPAGYLQRRMSMQAVRKKGVKNAPHELSASRR